MKSNILFKGSRALAGLGAALLLSSQAQAWMIASWGDAKYIDRTARTHILLAAKGKELGYMFVHAARMTAVRIKEANPKDQVVLIAVEERSVSKEDETPDFEGNKKRVEADGFVVRHQLKSEFDIDSMVSQMDTFKQIASLHVFSHSTPQFGALIEGKWNRIEVDGANDKRFVRLRDNLTKDAYAYFHGCNSGFMLAPMMSRVLGIPVAGSLTSTEFEIWGSEKTWESTSKFARPEGFKRAGVHRSVKSGKPVACHDDNCLRMRPIVNAYSGYWSKAYQAGLPIYKVFCVGKSPEACKLGMLKAAMHTPSVVNLTKESSFEDYKQVVNDIFCPTDKSGKLRAECLQALENPQANREYAPFKKKTISCDGNGCKFKFTCGSLGAFFVRDSCDIELTSSSRSTTYMDEYLDTLDAYKYLKTLE